MSSIHSSSSGRLAYLDWLRFIVVLSLAPFHAAISFTGVGSVYVYDTPVRDILLASGTPVNVGPSVLAYFTIFMDNWFMHLLFFISGIGVAHSLRRRGAAEFMGERCNRLMVPFLLGTLIIVPVQTWMGALAFGRFSGNVLDFLPRFFTWEHFNWGHLWFLLYLFAFSSLALPLFLLINRKGEGSRLFSVARRYAAMPLILLPALWTGLLEALLRPGWPGSLNLYSDWAVVTVSLSFFLAGYIAASVPGLLQAIEKHRLAALSLGAVAFAARMASYRMFAVPDGYNAANIIAQALRGVAAYGLVLAAMGYGRRYLNRQSAMLGTARDLSFPLYVLHYAPVTAATYLLLDSGLSVWARWMLAVAAAWGFTALFTSVARHIPPMRSFFGLRQPTSRARGSLGAVTAEPKSSNCGDGV